MSLKKQLLIDMKEAMKSKDVLRKNAIQAVRESILKREKDTQSEVTEEHILDILIQEIKKRNDSITDFEKGNRPDLVADAKREIEVLTSYLPKQLSEEELMDLIKVTIAELGASSKKDMGKVMAAITPNVKGKADTKKVSDIVKELLN